MSETIGRDEVIYVAKLARLDLTEEETTLFAAQLSSVIDHVAALRRLDTTGVRPTSHPLELSNVLREDVVVPSLDRDVVLASAPATEDGKFKVPSILGEAP
ncbi:MAG TPA: Asp-tRNA(Asn)/Glu-tRNA(Gln) amidotransferase subunit GatC [Acidimicrobiales bacterium]